MLFHVFNPLCRYVAVCEPLRYPAIMTTARLHFCCALAWFVALLCITVLFALHANVSLCGNTIRHVYCSNRSILSLACTPTAINNIYGQLQYVAEHLNRFTVLSSYVIK